MTEIVRDPDHSAGAPTIDDTGIRVLNVASAYEHSGYSPDEIVELYPALTLEDLHTALAYYYANIEEFRDAMAEAMPPRSADSCPELAPNDVRRKVFCVGKARSHEA